MIAHGRYWAPQRISSRITLGKISIILVGLVLNIFMFFSWWSGLPIDIVLSPSGELIKIDLYQKIENHNRLVAFICRNDPNDARWMIHPITRCGCGRTQASRFQRTQYRWQLIKPWWRPRSPAGRSLPGRFGWVIQMFILYRDTNNFNSHMNSTIVLIKFLQITNPLVIFCYLTFT